MMKTPLTVIKFDDADEDALSYSPFDVLDTGDTAWFRSDFSHAAPLVTPSVTPDPYTWNDFAADPFCFCLLGRSLWARSVQTRWFHSKTKPLDHATRGALRAGADEEPLEIINLKLKRLYHIAHTRVALKMGITTKVAELALAALIGSKYNLISWSSLALQLLCTIAGSVTEIWRYHSHFSLPEETMTDELRALAAFREHCCCVLQAIFKLLTGAIMIILACLSLEQNLTLDPATQAKVSYLGGGYCLGSVVTKSALTVWQHFTLRKLTHSTIGGKFVPVATSQAYHWALTADAILSHIVSLSSLKQAAVCFTTAQYEHDMEFLTRVTRYASYVDIVLGAAAILLAVIDFQSGWRFHPWGTH